MTLQPAPQKKWEITEEAFTRFLAWLHPDRDAAGERYEDIRRKLIKIFVCRGCTCPEELSDETINRVVRRVEDIGEIYVGDPALYFFGVAHKVHLEYVRKKPQPEPVVTADSSAETDAACECLEQCMRRLTFRSRDLFLQYYGEESGGKGSMRKRQAEKMGIPLNALRIRVCRIRANLESCVLECLRSTVAE